MKIKNEKNQFNFLVITSQNNTDTSMTLEINYVNFIINSHIFERKNYRNKIKGRGGKNSSNAHSRKYHECHDYT